MASQGQAGIHNGLALNFSSCQWASWWAGLMSGVLMGFHFGQRRATPILAPKRIRKTPSHSTVIPGFMLTSAMKAGGVFSTALSWPDAGP